MNKKGDGDVGQWKRIIGIILILLVIGAAYYFAEKSGVLKKLGLLPDFNTTQPIEIVCKYENCILMGGECKNAIGTGEIKIGYEDNMGCQDDRYCVVKKSKLADGELKITEYSKEVIDYNKINFYEQETKQIKDLEEPLEIVIGTLGEQRMNIGIEYPERQFCYLLRTDKREIISGKTADKLKLSPMVGVASEAEATLTLIAWDPYNSQSVSQGIKIKPYEISEELLKVKSGQEMITPKSISINNAKEKFRPDLIRKEISESGLPIVHLVTKVNTGINNNGNVKYDYFDWKIEMIEEDDKTLMKFYVLQLPNDERLKNYNPKNIDTARFVSVDKQVFLEEVELKGEETYEEVINKYAMRPQKTISAEVFKK
ncbi:hypothetical protein COU61_00735 [Candidatus Pacearchaeota archaeon CG10_big_fil_rev_8_21_14_0_10_35_13]|nr:MAG: hypothetical protein COU61_00735 [Candidatus Pacearchaeota archaeon CG10_big_fil_rev_8_21_14_0_10_35_13]